MPLSAGCCCACAAAYDCCESSGCCCSGCCCSGSAAECRPNGRLCASSAPSLIAAVAALCSFESVCYESPALAARLQLLPLRKGAWMVGRVSCRDTERAAIQRSDERRVSRSGRSQWWRLEQRSVTSTTNSCARCSLSAATLRGCTAACCTALAGVARLKSLPRPPCARHRFAALCLFRCRRHDHAQGEHRKQARLGGATRVRKEALGTMGTLCTAMTTHTRHQARRPWAPWPQRPVAPPPRHAAWVATRAVGAGERDIGRREDKHAMHMRHHRRSSSSHGPSPSDSGTCRSAARGHVPAQRGTCPNGERGRDLRRDARSTLAHDRRALDGTHGVGSFGGVLFRRHQPGARPPVEHVSGTALSLSRAHVFFFLALHSHPFSTTFPRADERSRGSFRSVGDEQRCVGAAHVAAPLRRAHGHHGPRAARGVRPGGARPAHGWARAHHGTTRPTTR